MEGVPAKDDKPAKPPVDTVTLTALGNAISVACFIGGTLEKESLATIASAVASVVMTCAVTGEMTVAKMIPPSQPYLYEIPELNRF